MTLQDKKITGVYIKFIRKPYRTVIRREIDLWHEHYDIYKHRTKIDAVVKILHILLDEIPDFEEKIQFVDENHKQQSCHRKRYYISRDKEKLFSYVGYSCKIGNLWLDTNLNEGQMLTVLAEACEAAKIEFSKISVIEI